MARFPSPTPRRNRMARFLLILAGLSGFLGVALGAFGAHALQDRLEPRMLEIFETGVRYHLIHALALFGVALLLLRSPSGWFGASGWLFAAGILVFSGSLYVLALTGIRGFGAVTPIGGLSFLLGWIALVVGAWTSLGSAPAPGG
jgi:uncharacterized membrane protein YgdD (TMEM256/DUF423 family)